MTIVKTGATLKKCQIVGRMVEMLEPGGYCYLAEIGMTTVKTGVVSEKYAIAAVGRLSGR